MVGSCHYNLSFRALKERERGCNREIKETGTNHNLPLETIPEGVECFYLSRRSQGNDRNAKKHVWKGEGYLIPLSQNDYFCGNPKISGSNFNPAANSVMIPRLQQILLLYWASGLFMLRKFRFHKTT